MAMSLAALAARISRASSSSWMRPAAGLERSFMGSVGVFNFNEGNISEFLIGPGKGDAPFGSPGVGINGISLGAVQFVVMKRMKGQKIFLGGMVEDEQAFLGFYRCGCRPIVRLLSWLGRRRGKSFP